MTCSVAGGLLDSDEPGIIAFLTNVKTAVLLIDSDLGFVFWLGRALDNAGYEAFPAKSISDALRLMAELHLSMSLVIVNHALPGAAEFIADLRNTQKLVKVMALIEDTDSAVALPDVDCEVVRPYGVDEEAKAEFVRTVRRVLGPTDIAHGMAVHRRSMP